MYLLSKKSCSQIFSQMSSTHSRYCSQLFVNSQQAQVLQNYTMIAFKCQQQFSTTTNFSQRYFFNTQNNNQLNKSSRFIQLTTRNFSGSLPPHLKLEMPNLSPTMEKGNIAKWNKKEGDKVAPGDILASIETDKATVDFEMQEEGYIAKLLYPAGTKDVALGKVIAILVDKKDDVDKFKDFQGDQGGAAPPKAVAPQAQSQPSAPKEQQQPQQSAPTTSSSTSGSGDRIFVSPLAKKTAAELGVELKGIAGSGPNNRILQQDVLSASSQQAAPTKQAQKKVAVQEDADFEDIPVTNIRKIIAEKLTYSKTHIPHFQVTYQVQMDNLMKLRTKLNAVSKNKISVNDLVIKAASLAAAKVPQTNSAWLDGNVIRQYKNVNMSIAVQTDNGLLVPVIENTNLKGLEQIAKEAKDLATRARDNKIKPQELSGGTFTISNMGMFGVHSFNAIINPPQACILAVSGTDKIVVPDDHAAKDSTSPFKVIQVMNVTLSSDHRVVDGAIAATWGQEFKKLMENPELMLL